MTIRIIKHNRIRKSLYIILGYDYNEKQKRSVLFLAIM